jgi:3'(2'), 5'-bisphosphate nucleotidase
MQLRNLAHKVIEIAEKAGEEIINIYENIDDKEIELKADQSPLTVADRNANNIITKGLKKLDIQFPIISEENENVDYEIRKNYDYYWLVDPLDGTKEFIKRNGEFTVNIALIHQERSILGVVYAPYLKEMFWAAKGEGAFLIKNGQTKKLSAPEFGFKDPALNIVCSRSHLNKETQVFVDKFDHPKLVAKGSSLKFTTIAKGEAHLYPRLAPTMEWDTAAAQIVLEEAGGKVLNAKTKMPLLYNKKELINLHFIAYGKVRE